MPAVRRFSESRRLASVQPPVIPVIGRWMSETPGTISLGQGVVSYAPPPEVVEAIRRFGTDADDHRYGPIEGLPPLVEALEAEAPRGERHPGPPGEPCSGHGGRQPGLHERRACDLRSGRRSHPAVPYYFNHEMADRDGGREPVSVFRPGRTTSSTWRRSPRPSRRARVRSSPSRRTIRPARSIRESSLRAVNALCRDRGLFHVHDEAYEYFTYGDATPFFAGQHRRCRPAHVVDLFDVESVRDGQLAYRISRDPGVARGCDQQGPGHGADLRAGISQQAALAARAGGPAICDRTAGRARCDPACDVRDPGAEAGAL